MSLRQAFVSAFIFALAPRTVSALQYEVFVQIETEEDLYDLLATEQISESSFNALLLLHQTRVDLNTANRDRLYLLPNLDYGHVDRLLTYRSERASIQSLDELVEAGALDAELAESIRAFVLVTPIDAPKGGADGFARAQTRWTGRYDRLPPASAIQARIRSLGRLDAGVAAVLSRNRLGRVRWDSNRQALSAEPERARFELPKAYLEWEDAKREVVAGSYRIGFGQRLTFDVTDQATPNGFFGDYELRREAELTLGCRRGAGELPSPPCRGDRVPRVTPDFAWTNRLAGLALGLKDISAGRGWLQLYGWGSYQVHRVPRIELVDLSRCDEPRQNEDPSCSAPQVYIRTGDPAAPSNTASYASLPLMFAEGLAGANASYFWNARAQLGLTGYASVPRWLIGGTRLGFQELSRKPPGGPFGAIGIHAAFGFGQQDFFAELARSFTAKSEESDGYAAIVRSVTTLPGTELEVSFRYYAARYVNPYARPISAPDELEGLRARDETGLRVRATSRLGERASLRLLADGWRRLSVSSLSALLFARLDLQLHPSWSWALWTEYRNNGAQRLVLASKLGYRPSQRLNLFVQLQHRSVDWRLRRGGVQQDLAAIFGLTARPVELLRLRFRLRYDSEDMANKQRLSQLLWSRLEALLSVRNRDKLTLRYDLRLFLDERASTRARVPNPEHWLGLEYLVRF